MPPAGAKSGTDTPAGVAAATERCVESAGGEAFAAGVVDAGALDAAAGCVVEVVVDVGVACWQPSHVMRTAGRKSSAGALFTIMKFNSETVVRVKCPVLPAPERGK